MSDTLLIHDSIAKPYGKTSSKSSQLRESKKKSLQLLKINLPTNNQISRCAKEYILSTSIGSFSEKLLAPIKYKKPHSLKNAAFYIIHYALSDDLLRINNLSFVEI